MSLWFTNTGGQAEGFHARHVRRRRGNCHQRRDGGLPQMPERLLGCISHSWFVVAEPGNERWRRRWDVRHGGYRTSAHGGASRIQ